MPCAPANRPRLSATGFTLLELLVVVAIIVLMAGQLLPALSRVKARATGIQCLNNERQLTLACLLYAADAADALPYNLGTEEIRQTVAQNRFLNWNSSIMSWELDPDNTNTFLLVQGGLGPHLGGAAGLYRCPSDSVVSEIQAQAGWRSRTRTYSMNAMVGNAGEFTKQGFNVNNPDYKQFFQLGQIPEPSRIFLMIEEHPDSLNDGYFLNKPESLEWIDLPASFHNGSANLSYADGHAASYQWRFNSTKPPAEPEAARLPLRVPAGETGDFRWLMKRTSVDGDAY